MFGPIESVIFDLDGTLVDTMPSIVKGLQEAIAATTGKTVAVADLVATFGPAPLGVLRNWVPEERLGAAYQHWLDFEKVQEPGEFRPFAGVGELLEALKSRGVRMGLFTGRDRAGTLRILKHHQWIGHYFTESTIVCGDDGYPVKPRPDALLHLLQAMRIDAATCLMVGDHPHDMAAGRAAGTRTAAALWDLPPGQRTHRSRFRDAWKKWDSSPADLRLESPLGLREWFRLKGPAQ